MFFGDNSLSKGDCLQVVFFWSQLTWLCGPSVYLKEICVDAVKANRGSRAIVPIILYHSIRWTSVVNFTPWVLYPWDRISVPFE